MYSCVNYNFYLESFLKRYFQELKMTKIREIQNFKIFDIIV